VKWVTRRNAKVDRIACPWLIRRFIDPQAEFLFVRADKVETVAEREGAIPFDVPGVELGHREGRCSFESLLRKYGLEDPALLLLGRIVHGRTSRRTWESNRKPRGSGRWAMGLPSCSGKTTRRS